MRLNSSQQLRLASGFVGIALFVASVVALRFAPRRLEVPVLMAAVSFIALGGAFSTRTA